MFQVVRFIWQPFPMLKLNEENPNIGFCPMTLGRTAMLRGIWLQIQQRHPSMAAVRDMENQGINGSDSTLHFSHLSKKA
jgi:hypothetical protein